MRASKFYLHTVANASLMFYSAAAAVLLTYTHAYTAHTHIVWCACTVQCLSGTAWGSWLLLRGAGDRSFPRYNRCAWCPQKNPGNCTEDLDVCPQDDVSASSLLLCVCVCLVTAVSQEMLTLSPSIMRANYIGNECMNVCVHLQNILVMNAWMCVHLQNIFVMITEDCDSDFKHHACELHQ